MVIGGHKHGRGEDCPQRSKAEMDKEVSEIRVEMDKLEFNMQHEANV
jgi:hypothetical protein